MPCVGLQCMIMVFPGHTHLLYDYEHGRLFLLLRLYIFKLFHFYVYMNMLNMYLFAFRGSAVLGVNRHENCENMDQKHVLITCSLHSYLHVKRKLE